MLIDTLFYECYLNVEILIYIGPLLYLKLIHSLLKVKRNLEISKMQFLNVNCCVNLNTAGHTLGVYYYK